jgi:hypothetical protein
MAIQPIWHSLSNAPCDLDPDFPCQENYRVLDGEAFHENEAYLKIENGRIFYLRLVFPIAGSYKSIEVQGTFDAQGEDISPAVLLALIYNKGCI